MITVLGAGAVGLLLGGRLARAGREVLFVTRRAEVARQIQRDGVELEDPASGTCSRVPGVALDCGGASAPPIGRGPVLVCVRGPDTEAAARWLAGAAPGATVVSVQNDVDNEAKLARHFGRVLGVAFRQTCTRVEPNRVRASGGGRLAIGAHPEGSGPDVERLAADLRAAGYDVGVSPRIVEDKWLKLCVNLMSAPNALVRRDDHNGWQFVELKARLLEEASATLEAAGIAASSCDGRDRSLPEEIAYQRESLQLGTRARRLPIYNQVWSALRRGGTLEADAYHRRILDLAARHAVAAPANARVLTALERAAREGLGPECVSASELLGSA